MKKPFVLLSWRWPLGLLCLPVESQSLPIRVILPAKALTPQSHVPHWGSQCTRALSNYTCEDSRVLFVQAFWLCHSPVTTLLHLPASAASFPHTPSWWKSPLASSLSKHRREASWDTTLENEVPEFPTEGRWHTVCSNPTWGLELKLTASPAPKGKKNSNSTATLWAVWPNV